MKHKYKVFNHLKNFVARISIHVSTQIQQIQSSGGGGKYDNNYFNFFGSSLGIYNHHACPHTPEQNGLTKQKHHRIASVARTILLTSHVTINHWP